MVAFNWENREEMTPERMLSIIRELGDKVVEEGNVIHFQYKGVAITLVFDTAADRMRLISPIIKQTDLESEQLETAMKANFHSALDARYCISDGIVWSAFIHPLSDLTPSLLSSGVIQVATANITFGDDYTSGHLVFQG